MNHLCRRFTVLLLIGAGVASAAEPVAGRTADELKANLGKTITARGVWSDRGKFGSYVAIHNGEQVEISGTTDQANRLYGLWDERRVRIVGTLRYFEIPAAKRAEITAEYGATVAAPPDYYYVSIDDLRVEDEAHPEFGLQRATHQPTRRGFPVMLYRTWRPVNAEPRAVTPRVSSGCGPNLLDPHYGRYVSKLGVMIKREAGFDPTSGDWEFLFVDQAKKVIYDRVETLNCRMCHATRSSQDFVFREGLAKPSK